MSGAIPTSTSVVESAVIKAPLSHVWHFIKLQDFSKLYAAQVCPLQYLTGLMGNAAGPQSPSPSS